MKRKTFYYKDELNDDFAQENIKPIKIDSNYKYIHKNILWKIFSFIIYRVFGYAYCFYLLKSVFWT